jgi:hypothetical protein
MSLPSFLFSMTVFILVFPGCTTYCEWFAQLVASFSAIFIGLLPMSDRTPFLSLLAVLLLRYDVCGIFSNCGSECFGELALLLVSKINYFNRSNELRRFVTSSQIVDVATSS